LLAGGGAITAAAIAEYALSAALLMLTPLWLLRRLGFRPVPDAAQGEMLCRAVDARLCRARDALAGIADVTQQVAKRLEGLRGDPLEAHLTRATDAVCRGCGQSPRCWQTAYSVTDDAVRHFFAAARARCGEADETDFPAHFSCERLPRLMPALNEEARSYARQQNARRQASQMRAVSADQFEGMSLLLDGISREVAALLPAPAAVSAAIEQYFERAGAQPLSVCCALDELQRISVVAVFPARKATRLDLAKVTAELSELASQELALPEQLFEGDSTRLWWSVRARFAAECGHAQRAARCARLCGDSVADFRDAAGRAVLLLSDGMGVGGSAAVDATMTTSLLSRLLRAGATFDAALRLVNAALLSGGGEERLCTVDACVLDLTTGQLDLYKAGAAPTFLIRQNRVQRIETASLPAGILGGAEARHTVLTLGDGDVVVMVSDGVTDTGTDWIPSQLQALAGQTPAVLCERLLATAVERRIGDREDDMSVLAAVVTQD
ncbi:MAG: SpoIIE family protein phosphatase, partial [Oscillospiraceae bacterium]